MIRPACRRDVRWCECALGRVASRDGLDACVMTEIVGDLIARGGLPLRSVVVASLCLWLVALFLHAGAPSWARACAWRALVAVRPGIRAILAAPPPTPEDMDRAEAYLRTIGPQPGVRW